MNVVVTFLRALFSPWLRPKTKAMEPAAYGSERRQTERLNPLYYLPVYTRTEQSLLGHVYDISTEGCMMVSPRTVRKGLTYQVALKMPKNLGPAEGLSAEARCVWTKKDFTTDLQTAGFTFESINDEGKNAIRTMMKDYCFQG